MPYDVIPVILVELLIFTILIYSRWSCVRRKTKSSTGFSTVDLIMWESIDSNLLYKER